ncbi:Oxidoreductase, molybdopterin-binding domain-containing protein [Coniochaeta sp. 2T2.1]|nr:Oxidoreductase, molybdopterin-binding domain-containing protein [Coniochaeta sp. 2T2.1]
MLDDTMNASITQIGHELDSSWNGPAWKFDMSRADMFGVPHQRYNTYAAPLQLLLYLDVGELATTAKDRADDFETPMCNKYLQKPDEWLLEQGLEPAKLGLRNQSDVKINLDSPQTADPNETELKLQDNAPEENPDFVVTEERNGWKGYVEWEDYPEKKDKAHKRFKRYKFPPPPEFQLGPMPPTNPVLEGVRWKLWHKAIGGALEDEKHHGMLHLLQFPYNGEPPKGLLIESPITPNGLHFVRNHGGIPDIDPQKFDLRLDGLVANPQKLTLADLQNESKFPRVTKLVTIQCSGSRRFEQIQEFGGEGDEMINAPWAEGAISTAKWTGVSLKKVIKCCGGLKDGGKHLEFYGAETYFKSGELMNYVVSVPWSKVKANEVLLAWEMNDTPLPRIHRFPLRAVVMGYIGARSVKWLYRVKAIAEPSRAPVQAREYLYTIKYNLPPSLYSVLEIPPTTMPSTDPGDLHGWSAVPLDLKILLNGKPYISEPQPIRVDDIKFPIDDPIVAKVNDYAKENLSGPTFNHCMRVFYYCAPPCSQSLLPMLPQRPAPYRLTDYPTPDAAMAILTQQFPTQAALLSPSTLALACLLHDVGLTPANMRSTRLSFEYHGAFLALDLVGAKLGGEPAQAEAVAEAIIRHTDIGTSGQITFLGQLLQVATIHDNVGDHAALVHEDTRRDVNGRFSRRGWNRCFGDTIGEELRLKPWAHLTFLGDFAGKMLENKLAEGYE